MFEIIFSAVVSSIISLLIKAGLEDKVNPLKKLFSPSQEKQRMKALQRAFQKAKDEFHDPGMGALLENPSFQEFVIACLLDPEQRLNFDDAAHLLGKQFEQHRRSIKRFLNIMEYHLMEDETWSEILERFRTLRSQQEIKSLLEKNGQVSTPTVIRAVVEQLATLSDAVKSLEKDDLSQEISRAVVEKLGIRDQKTLRELYLKQVAWEANKLPWTIISSDYSDEQKARIIQLDEVYTDLDTCEVQQIDREDAYTLMMKNIRERELVPALQMIDRHSRLLVMGNPGSGKSTFVKYVACLLAQAGLNGEPHLQKLAPWSHGALLPVFVELRGFSAWLRNQTSRKSTHQCLTNYLKARLSDDETIAEFWPQFADLLASDKPALIIFDGLDEVPQDHRGAVVDCVNDFAGFYNDNRYIVTCRPYAYIGQPFQLDDFHTATLAPFSEEKIQEYIKKWYHLQEIKGYFKPSDAIDRANRLIAAIRARGLRDLAERPLLLTIMVQIHSTKKRLPQDRTELYADAVNLFLERWEGHVDQENNILDVLNMPGLKMSHLRAAIYEVAFRAHQSAASAEEAADIEEEHLRAWMAPHLDGVIKKAELFVDYIHERAGLLIRHKTDAYQFPHRSFQEFLAACHLLMQEDFITEATGLVSDNYDQWREVIVLAAGYAARTDRVGSAVGLVNELCPHEYGPERSKLDVLLASLAGECIVEIGERSLSARSGAHAIQRVRGWLTPALRDGVLLSARERAQAGVTLAHLGDPRVEIMTIDDMPFCWVPGGEFWMGEDKEQHLNGELKDDYWVAQFPMSNSQYNFFVADGGYGEERWWPEACAADFWQDGRFKGRYDQEPRTAPYDYGAPFNLGNHPVVGVSWYEALAFCRWLDARFRDQLGDWSLRLISEAEWEKAARGGLRVPKEAVIRRLRTWPFDKTGSLMKNNDEKRDYPWLEGEMTENANYDETGLHATSALGCFPAGRSPLGAEEMSGNVWEWTRSLWGKEWDKPDFRYPYKVDQRENLTAGKEIWRVLRGGSWSGAARLLRCAFRLRYHPDYWNVNSGFRLVLSPHRSGL